MKLAVGFSVKINKSYYAYNEKLFFELSLFSIESLNRNSAKPFLPNAPLLYHLKASLHKK